MTRVPPHDLEAEQAVLGSMMLSAEAAEGAAGLLSASDFYRDSHGAIFSAAVGLVYGHEPVDQLSVAGALGPDIGTVGGKPYLLDLTGSVPTSTHWHRYATTVLDHSRRRRLIGVAAAAAAAAYDQADPSETIARMVHDSEGLAGAAHKAGTVADLMPSVIDLYREPVDTIRDDEFGLTFRNGDFVIVGARPGVGKSALAGQLAQQFAGRHLRVGLYTYEMGEEQFCTRFIQSATGLSLSDMEAGLEDPDGLQAHMLSGDWSRFLSLIPAAGMSIDAVVADIRRRARRGMRIACIDYLQLMVTQSYEDVTEASRRLKLLAREVNIPIVALSQLSRRVGVDGKLRQPALTDLRQSGALEQDADIVFLLHAFEGQEEAEKRKALALRGWHTDDPAHSAHRLCLVDCAKNRHGPAWSSFAFFDGVSLAWIACNRSTDHKPI